MSDYTHFLDMFRHNGTAEKVDAAEPAVPETAEPEKEEEKKEDTRQIYIEPIESHVQGSLADPTPILTPDAGESVFDRLVTAQQEQPRKISAQPQDAQPEEDAETVFLDDTPAETKSSPAGDTKPIVVKGNDKGSLLRAIAHSSENKDSSVPVPEQERVIAENLRQVREKRIEDFGLRGNTPPLTDAEEKVPEKGLPVPGFLRRFSDRFADKDTPFVPLKGAEYGHTAPDRRRVVSLLTKKKNELVIRTGILGILGLVLLLINIITTASAARNNGFFMVFHASSAVYATLNLVFLVLAGAVLFPDLKNGVVSLLQLRPRTEAALLGMMTASLVQTVCLYGTKLQPEYSYHLFSGAAILLSGVYTASKYFWNENTRYCFRTASVTEKLSYLREVRSSRVLSGILSEKQNPGVRADFCAEADRISDFLGSHSDSARSSMPKVILVPALYLAALLCGVITAIVEKSPVCGVSAAAAVLCFSFPVCGVFAGGFLLSRKNRELSQSGAFIRNYADAHGFTTVDHFAFDADELFNAHIVHIECTRGLQEFAAASCACVLADAAGGCLAQAFSVVRSGEKAPRLPKPEQISFEERLGVSAWVDGCRVLLGTSEMMINHNVTLPELKPADPGQALLILAIEGSFAASFTVQYDFDPETAQALRTIAQTGVNFLVRTSDPNITGHRIQSYLHLPENSVKIVPNSGIDLFDRIHDRFVPEENTGVAALGGLSGLAKCVAECVDTDRKGRSVGLICTAAAAAGAGIAVLLTLTGGMGRAAGWNAVLLQGVWCAAAVLGSGSMVFSRFADKAGGKKTAAEKQTAKPQPKKPENAKKTAAVLDTLASALNDIVKKPQTNDAKQAAVKRQPQTNDAKQAAVKRQPKANNAEQAAGTAPKAQHTGKKINGAAVAEKMKKEISGLVHKRGKDSRSFTVSVPAEEPAVQPAAFPEPGDEIGDSNPGDFAEQLNFVLNTEN